MHLRVCMVGLRRLNPLSETAWGQTLCLLCLPNCIYRSRATRVDSSHERWSVLYADAQREDAEEAAYYEQERLKRAGMRDAARAAAEEKWHKKIDNIMRDGTLSYKIRKAKITK